MASATATKAMSVKEKPKGAGPQGKSKIRGKKGKGAKAKAEVPEETDPRKLELLNWVSLKQLFLLHYTTPFCIVDQNV